MRGLARLQDARVTKGTAFTEEERDRHGLRGLLPPRVMTMQHQVDRIMENLRAKPSPLEKYILLVALQNRNERLFFRTLIDNIDEIMPLVYTPTVGEACLRYAHIFREPRGLFVSLDDLGRVDQLLRNWPEDDVAVIVVTDGQRILGLGDLGANGMGIPVGKLALYTACAGVHPHKCLPVVIDAGTNNEALLADPLYLGLPRKRVTGPGYDALVDEFMQAAAQRFPDALIQFEDFESSNAFRFLKQYRDRYRCFNDDIQGTAAVTLAGLLGAARALETPLEEMRILFAGAGSAALGTAGLTLKALMARGLPEHEARARIALTDVDGLLTTRRSDLAPERKVFAKDLPDGGLLESIRHFRPHMLIGATGVPGVFSQAVVQAMAEHNARPVIFALSNPTSRSECTAEQAYSWSDGRALFASGSPFAPVEINGVMRRPAQGNNVYIFPGVGMGALAACASHVSEHMFLRAAEVLADQVYPIELEAGALYPPLRRIRRVCRDIAIAVAQQAVDDALAEPRTRTELEARIDSMTYAPHY
ncbi:MAG: NAD-dependent malic enzyme [Salinisphaeraceae bacterium]|nr:NAD-dependent malic enzyme [Salinisphaeraceae bacterium]